MSEHSWEAARLQGYAARWKALAKRLWLRADYLDGYSAGYEVAAEQIAELNADVVRYEKALTAIADPYNAKYHEHSAARIAKQALHPDKEDP